MARTPLEIAIEAEEIARDELKIASSIPGSVGLRTAAEHAKQAADAWQHVYDWFGGDEIDADLRRSIGVDMDQAADKRWRLLDDAAVAISSAYARSGEYRDLARAAEMFWWAAEMCEDADRQEELHEAAYRLARRAGYEAHKLGLPE